jgi:hypothetical protein
MGIRVLFLFPGGSHAGLFFSNRSQVQGSTFTVKDKEGIEDPKPSLKYSFSHSTTQRGLEFGGYAHNPFKLGYFGVGLVNENSSYQY